MAAGDTIVACATPPGRGALAVLRVSGPAAATYIPALTGRDNVPLRQATVCALKDPDGSLLDQAVLVAYAAPASATGEDMLEITCHGAPVVVEQLLTRLHDLGARGAEPGEFSRRAFANGKVDLAQAQATADLIAATSQRAARCAARVLAGAVSAELRTLCAALEDLLVPLEGGLDFPDDELGPIDHSARTASLHTIAQQLARLVARARQGRIVHAGIRLALLGPPNVGKSSLLNRCTRTDTAIVTAEPGTTRDVLTAAVQIGGIACVLCDTAGIRDSSGAIEAEGVRRSWQTVDDADLILQLFDAYAGWGAADQAIAERIADRAHLVIANKCDLLKNGAAVDGPAAALACSAKTGAGLDAVFTAIAEQLQLDTGLEEDEFMAHARQIAALTHAHACVTRAATASADELIAEELRQARGALGQLIGELTTEELLGEIFARFCIGK